jgi:hypothetical protein
MALVIPVGIHRLDLGIFRGQRFCDVHRFRSTGRCPQVSDLLHAVAAFAAGGLTALSDLRTDSARKLLGQLNEDGPEI